MAGYSTQKEADGPQGLEDLSEHRLGVRQMFDDLLGTHHIQGAGGEGEPLRVGQDEGETLGAADARRCGLVIEADSAPQLSSADLDEAASPAADIDDASRVGEVLADERHVLGGELRVLDDVLKVAFVHYCSHCRGLRASSEGVAPFA